MLLSQPMYRQQEGKSWRAHHVPDLCSMSWPWNSLFNSHSEAGTILQLGTQRQGKVTYKSHVSREWEWTWILKAKPAPQNCSTVGFLSVLPFFHFKLLFFEKFVFFLHESLPFFFFSGFGLHYWWGTIVNKRFYLFIHSPVYPSICLVITYSENIEGADSLHIAENFFHCKVRNVWIYSQTSTCDLR